MNNPKVILITGSSRGIGAELFKSFAQTGFKVILNYSKSDIEAEQLFEDVSQYSKDILKVKADVSDRIQVQNMFDQTLERFGRVDVLINNASLNLDDSFINMSDEKWKKVLDINLTGTFICSQEFVFHFQGTEGHIINIGASTGLKGRKNGANYCSAKAGVITLTKCLALELAPKIKVNCVIPGFIDTDEVITRYHLNEKESFEQILKTIPLEQLGKPGDIFKAVNFLINESSYITGQNLFVNGGSYLG